MWVFSGAALIMVSKALMKEVRIFLKGVLVHNMLALYLISSLKVDNLVRHNNGNNTSGCINLFCKDMCEGGQLQLAFPLMVA